MAEEGEGNPINARKRKSTEPISHCLEEKGTSQEELPPEKLYKPNEDSKTIVEDARSTPTDISSDISNSESKLISHNDQKEITSFTESKCIPEVVSNNKSPETLQIQNDVDSSTSNTDMYANKSTVKDDDTIVNGKADESFQSTEIKLNENETSEIQTTTDELQKNVDSIFQDELIVLDETGNASFREDEAEPIITISFSSKEVFENYGHEFTAFGQKYSELQVIQDTVKLSLNLIPNHDANVNHYATQWNVIDQYDSNQEMNQQKNSKRKQSKAKKELFTLDATPSISTTRTGCQYTSKFAAIIVEPKGVNGGNSVKKTNLSMCFNCDGSHALKDCPIPKDYQKINQARSGFQKRFQQTNRYHDDEEQKYFHIQPGTISSGLRTALGLGDNQIPSYIYKMRIHGYPPGWIEEATDHGSSMAVFGIDGKVADTGKGGVRFNAAKIVHYAGFNVKMEKGMRDEFAKNNVPPFSKDHSTDLMLTYIRKMESTCNDNKDVCDMDVDKDDDEACAGNDEIETIEQVAPPGCEDENSSNDTKTSLGDLESQKQQLLAELNESRENSQDTEPVTTDNEPNCVQNTTLNASTSANLQEHSTPSNRLKVSEFGTPIIKSASPYSHLPNAENFSVGVSDVINFENLPNSTGAYEKMTGLISRVRETLKSLQCPSST